MDVYNLDKEFFNSLKKKYVPAFVDNELDKYARNMVGYYLLKNEDASYKFDLNIKKKIVLVSVAKENGLFVLLYCKIEYLKYVTPTKSCPRDIDPIYQRKIFENLFSKKKPLLRKLANLEKVTSDSVDLNSSKFYVLGIGLGHTEGFSYIKIILNYSQKLICYIV